MSTYRIADKSKVKKAVDSTKRNILLIGSANNNSQSKIILNPLNTATAKSIYGDNNPLFNAYKQTYEITNDTNIYTVNCPMSTDFIEIIDTIINYNFNYIVPIDIYLEDTFINPINNKETYFCNYYLERLGTIDNLATIIMTNRPSYLYESIDDFIVNTKDMFRKYKQSSLHILEKFGSNIIFTLNNLNESCYSNVLLAAILSTNTFIKYPNSVPFKTHFDIDGLDINDNNISYFKYCANTNSCTIENLKNLRLEDDIYKWVLVDEAIKYVIRSLNLDEYRGRLYSPYVKLQIDTRVKRLMEEMKGVVFKQYTIETIQFVKTAPAVGYINIKLSIVPFGTLEKINIVKGV